MNMKKLIYNDKMSKKYVEKICQDAQIFEVKGKMTYIVMNFMHTY